MTTPNMACTESLERSLQNYSLNHEIRSTNSGGDEVELIAKSSTLDDNNNSGSILPITVSDTSLDLELNSHLCLPYLWEQCLDLKSGEVYFINWRNGMKAREDPTTTAQYSREFYSEEDEDNDSSYDSEEKDKDSVLVVAGCKSCLMYFMVPKQVEDCPKCNGQLLHFDRFESSSS